MNKQVADAEAWDTLHDLMLIYLAFMHGSQAMRSSFSIEAVLIKMQTWLPDQGLLVLRQALTQVMLAYMSAWGVKMLETAVLSLREVLPETQRADILVDITKMVGKDGLFYPDDATFIEQIAHVWDVERYICDRCPGAVSP